MDPTTAANQKRKRGRSTNASRDDEPKDAPNFSTTLPQENQLKTNGEMEGDAIDESSRPRKRGRRAKDKPQPESTQTQRTRQRRRQTSAAQMEGFPKEEAGEYVPSEAIEVKKRGRPRRGDQRTKAPELEADEADDENENEGDSSLLRRSKRNRRSIDASPPSSDNHAAQRAEVKSLANKQAARRRKRPIQLGDNEQPNEEAGPEAEAETTSRAQKKRKKRLRPLQDSQPPVEEVEPEPEPEPVLPRKKRSRAIQGGLNGRREEPADEEPQAESQLNRSSRGHRKSKSPRQASDRQDHSPAHSSSPESASSPPPYRHIAKRTRRVTHEVIKSKWSSLGPSSLVSVATLFHSASQPTLLHVAPKQYLHAEEVLEKVIRSLYKRSGKLPFPPASTLPHREDELDFERTQSGIEVLLSQLDPLQHSVELLRREKERAERELEREYKVLDRLSTNARAEARERRDRLRKVHVLVPEKASSPATGSIDLLPADKGAGKVFSDVRDEELLSLAGQLNNHMQSMRGNLYQIDGVLPAVAKSHALLRTTLQPHFGRKQFENIMLGQIEQ